MGQPPGLALEPNQAKARCPPGPGRAERQTGAVGARESRAGSAVVPRSSTILTVQRAEPSREHACRKHNRTGRRGAWSLQGEPQGAPHSRPCRGGRPTQNGNRRALRFCHRTAGRGHIPRHFTRNGAGAAGCGPALWPSGWGSPRHRQPGSFTSRLSGRCACKVEERQGKGWGAPAPGETGGGGSHRKGPGGVGRHPGARRTPASPSCVGGGWRPVSADGRPHGGGCPSLPQFILAGKPRWGGGAPGHRLQSHPQGPPPLPQGSCHQGPHLHGSPRKGDLRAHSLIEGSSSVSKAHRGSTEASSFKAIPTYPGGFFRP